MEVYIEEGGQIVEYLPEYLKRLDVRLISERRRIAEGYHPCWSLKLEGDTENPAVIQEFSPTYWR